MIDLPPGPEEQPADQAQRVDETCDRYEAAWMAANTSGSPPQIEDFLNDVPTTDHTILLRELILLDLHYRRQRGETPQPGDYLGRFPSVDPAWLTTPLSSKMRQRRLTRRKGASIKRLATFTRPATMRPNERRKV